jgi:ABC-type sugar transport system ATPase subunit
MDEPTTALTHHEVEQLFARVRALRASGISILFVSHKMREMLEIADSLTCSATAASWPRARCATSTRAASPAP